MKASEIKPGEEYAVETGRHLSFRDGYSSAECRLIKRVIKQCGRLYCKEPGDTCDHNRPHGQLVAVYDAKDWQGIVGERTVPLYAVRMLWSEYEAKRTERREHEARWAADDAAKRKQKALDTRDALIAKLPALHVALDLRPTVDGGVIGRPAESWTDAELATVASRAEGLAETCRATIKARAALAEKNTEGKKES